MREPQGLMALPGFEASLRLLLDSERYSLTDIGMMFGVSRERVRQLCARMGLGIGGEWRGLNHIRVWDDRANRFRPQSRGAFNKKVARSQADQRSVERKRKSIESRAAQRAEVVAHARRLVVELGRAPTMYEVACSVYGRAIGNRAGGSLYLALRWTGRSTFKSGDITRITGEICAAAGIPKRPVGYHGTIPQFASRPEGTDAPAVAVPDSPTPEPK